jgi:copper chaperone CopZ
VRAAFLKVAGVQAAEVDFPGGRARVTYDPNKLRPEQLPEALKGTAFTASLKTPEKQ